MPSYDYTHKQDRARKRTRARKARAFLNWQARNSLYRQKVNVPAPQYRAPYFKRDDLKPGQTVEQIWPGFYACCLADDQRQAQAASTD